MRSTSWFILGAVIIVIGFILVVIATVWHGRSATTAQPSPPWTFWQTVLLGFGFLLVFLGFVFLGIAIARAISEPIAPIEEGVIEVPIETSIEVPEEPEIPLKVRRTRQFSKPLPNLPTPTVAVLPPSVAEPTESFESIEELSPSESLEASVESQPLPSPIVKPPVPPVSYQVVYDPIIAKKNISVRQFRENCQDKFSLNNLEKAVERIPQYNENCADILEAKASDPYFQENPDVAYYYPPQRLAKARELLQEYQEEAPAESSGGCTII